MRNLKRRLRREKVRVGVAPSDQFKSRSDLSANLNLSSPSQPITVSAFQNFHPTPVSRRSRHARSGSESSPPPLVGVIHLKGHSSSYHNLSTPFNTTNYAMYLASNFILPSFSHTEKNIHHTQFNSNGFPYNGTSLWHCP